MTLRCDGRVWKSSPPSAAMMLHGSPNCDVDLQTARDGSAAAVDLQLGDYRGVAGVVLLAGHTHTVAWLAAWRSNYTGEEKGRRGEADTKRFE
ncbi:hypothetical protein PoB_001760600 [Plakobranchus ocellatus]|uniref:Uncharacterized protein n=1 Tax=Plakobranchus ocellatus TaxID=259542 RepID=A0AAV3YVG6_9GAST|nr:hypothetical protein PoB_001760600 [Plakobranchus ocellatus]